jgi:hypothetical protein
MTNSLTPTPNFAQFLFELLALNGTKCIQCEQFKEKLSEIRGWGQADQFVHSVDRALKSVNLIQSSLDCRANVEQFNHQCFERSAKIYEPLDIEVKKPRICGRQIMRDNVEAESPEDYFRKSITVPFLYLK